MRNKIFSYLTLFLLICSVTLFTTGIMAPNLAHAYDDCRSAGCIGGVDPCYAPPQGGMCYTNTDKVEKE